jgi:hypothetical protein
LRSIVIALSVAFVVWLFVDRIQGPRIHEPLTWDEIGTLGTYSWVGFHPNGVPRQIPRADEMRNLPRPTSVQLAAGLYRALAVWREPNNHIPHSVLVNLSFAAFPRGEREVRIPAWLGAVVFAVSMAWLARQSGSQLTWPLALVLAAGWPYVHHYSLEARGYTWMLALQALLLIALHRLSTRPTSLIWGTLCGLISVLTFWNIISLALDWLIPLYCTFWLSPPIRDAEGPSAEPAEPRRRAYRLNLLVQWVAISFAGLVFLIDHLPYVLVSVQEYGVATPPSQFLARSLEVVQFLLPGAGWLAIGLVGVLGWILLLSTNNTRHLGLLCGLTLLVSATHALLAGKFPYHRTCGYFIPLLVLGGCHALERLLRPRVDWARTALLTLILAGVAALTANEQLATGGRVGLVAYRDSLRHQHLPGRPYIATDDPDDGWVRLQHLPTTHLTAYETPEMIATATHLGFLIAPSGKQGPWTGASDWPVTALGDRLLRMEPAKARLVQVGSEPASYPSILVWALDPCRAELRNEHLNEALLGLPVPHQTQHRQRFNKWEFSNQVHSVEFLIRDRQDYRQVVDAIQKAQPALGARAVIIEPSLAEKAGRP